MRASRTAGLDTGPWTVFRTADPARCLTVARLCAWREDGVTAIVAEETDTGGAWRALLGAVRAAGWTCPDDISLALLGDPPADLVSEPSPTGFDIPRSRLGGAAVRRLTALVAA